MGKGEDVRTRQKRCGWGSRDRSAGRERGAAVLMGGWT